MGLSNSNATGTTAGYQRVPPTHSSNTDAYDYIEDDDDEDSGVTDSGSSDSELLSNEIHEVYFNNKFIYFFRDIIIKFMIISLNISVISQIITPSYRI